MILLSQEISYKQYTVADGLKQMQVNHISADSLGNLWISTRGGVSKFNGKNFDNYDDITCMPKYANASMFSKDILWVISGNNLIKIEKGQCKEYPLPNYMKVGYGTRIYETPHGICIYHYSSTLTFFKDEIFKKVEDLFLELEGKSIIQFNYFKNDSRFEFVTEDSLLIRYKNRLKLKNIKLPDTPFRYRYSEVKLHDNHNPVLIGTRERTTYVKSQGDSLIILAEKQEDGNIELLNRDQIQSYKTLHSYHFRKDGFTEAIDIYGTDRWNILWADYQYGGTTFLLTDKGLIELSENPFFNYKEKDLPNAWSVIEGMDSEIYIAGYNQGIKKVLTDSISKISTVSYYCDFHKVRHENFEQFYFGACKDNHGTIYFPSGRGMYKLEDEILDTFSMNCRPPNKRLATIHSFYDDKNSVVAALNCKDLRLISVLDGSETIVPLQRFNAKSCLLHGTSINNNEYLFAYRPHFASYNLNLDSIEIFSHPDSTVSNPTFMSTSKDILGNIWIGSTHGILILDPDKNEIIQFPYYKNEIISSIYSYSESKLFLGMGNELVMINPKEYWQNGTLQAQVFNQSNGFQGIEPNQNGFYLDSKERLWITSSTHLSYTYPEYLEYENYELTPQIFNINDQRHYNGDDNYKLEKGLDMLTIKYGLISNPYPQEPQYSYRLNGNLKWSSWTESQFVSLSNLSSGTYKFELRARDAANDQVSQITDQVNFEIRRNILDEPGMGLKLIFALIAALASIGFILYRNRELSRTKKLTEQNLELEQKNSDHVQQLKENLERENERLQIIIEKQKESQLKTSLIKIVDNTDILLDPQDIIYTKTDKNLSTVYMANGDKHQFWSTVKNIKNRVPVNQFVQISRSTIINTLRLNHVNYKSVKLDNDQVLEMSSSGKDRLKDHIDGVLFTSNK